MMGWRTIVVGTAGDVVDVAGDEVEAAVACKSGEGAATGVAALAAREVAGIYEASASVRFEMSAENWSAM
jgi:hypothetical protein